jgi:short-subunit dehydrogenase
MSKTIAIFGAGTGLGISTARRFGREGYQVALIGRREHALATLVDQLMREGLNAAAFPADLAQTSSIPELISSISTRLGGIEVAAYSPVSTNSFIPATELTADVMQSFLNLHLLTPIEIVRQVLPSMIEKRHGAILMTMGSSAAHPSPFMSGVGPAMAAVRNYVHSLHGEVAEKGVYVGTLLVGALILGSAWHRELTSGGSGVPAGVPTVDPAQLTNVLWDLFTSRDRIESVVPVPG